MSYERGNSEESSSYIGTDQEESCEIVSCYRRGRGGGGTPCENITRIVQHRRGVDYDDFIIIAEDRQYYFDIESVGPSILETLRLTQETLRVTQGIQLTITCVIAYRKLKISSSFLQFEIFVN